MKYLSLDIETTSLTPSPDHILMVSMIVEETGHPEVPVEELPHFTCFVRQEKIEGDAYALAMNGWILDFISGRAENPTYEILNPDEWSAGATAFFLTQFGEEKITVAGKNAAGFDILFLPREVAKSF